MVTVGFMEVDLTPIERRVYELICGSDEVMCKQIPPKLAGAIPGLTSVQAHSSLGFVRACPGGCSHDTPPERVGRESARA